MTIIQTPDDNYIHNTIVFTQIFIGLTMLIEIISTILFIKNHKDYSRKFDSLSTKILIISCILSVFYGVAVIIRQMNNLFELGRMLP